MRIRNIKKPKKIKPKRKVTCPFCYTSNADDIIDIRPGFYCCRRCNEYFLFDTHLKGV